MDSGGGEFFPVGLKPFRSTQASAGLWDVGYGGDSGTGRNGRHPVEPMPFWPGSTSSALDLVPNLPANGGHPIPGGASRSASYPLDAVHQARMTKGV